MASLDARRSRASECFFEQPLFLRRTRRDIADLIGWVWLAIEFARLVRSRFTNPHPL